VQHADAPAITGEQQHGAVGSRMTAGERLRVRHGQRRYQKFDSLGVVATDLVHQFHHGHPAGVVRILRQHHRGAALADS